MEQRFTKPTIVDIVKLAKWKDIKRASKYYYPFDKNDYTTVFALLKTFRKRKPERVGEFLEVYVVNEILIKDMPYPENSYGIHTNKYSLSFRSWREVANLPIAEETLKNHTIEEILAHFIYEITFYGNETDMRKTKKEVFASSRDLRKQLAKENKK